MSTPTSDVLEMFRAQANLNSLAVLSEARQPVGIVHRHSLAEALLKTLCQRAVRTQTD